MFMDLLSDLFRQAGMKGRLLHWEGLPKRFTLQFPCDKSMGFHAVTHGSVFLHLSDDSVRPIELNKGDVALMARGRDHLLSTEKRFVRSSVRRLGDPRAKVTRTGTGSESQTGFVSGAYQFWHTPVHPFFREMPDWFVVRSTDLRAGDPLSQLITMIAEETRWPTLASENVTQGLADMIFHYILRKVIEQDRSRLHTWAHAMQDRQVAQAIELMHAHCALSWTVEELARRLGMSRSGFARRFQQALGDTPLHYLSKVRVQTAMRLLTESDDKLDTIALSVGYGDAFGFSKAFKRLTGVSPKDFRTKDRAKRGPGFKFRF
jgi:AraC-like DNA-binding protein